MNNENNENNYLNYKSIPLMLTGEISSSCISRNNFTTAVKQSTISFKDNMEDDDDDEQFILNLKKNIERYKMQNKENYRVKDLQSKSYSSKRKKSVFSDEDQNLIKRFKNSVDKVKAAYEDSQKLQKSEDIDYANNESNSQSTNNILVATNIPPAAPLLFTAATLNNVDDKTDDNNIDINLRNRTNQFFFHMTSKMQNNQIAAPLNINTVMETEIEELIYYELQYLTPPHEID